MTATTSYRSATVSPIFQSLAPLRLVSGTDLYSNCRKLTGQSSFSVSDYECEVCITFGGRDVCRTVKGKTQEETLRGGVNNACALLASGVTDTMRCSRTEPRKAQCRHLVSP